MINKINKIKNILIKAIMFLILGIRPILGPPNCCKYIVTCTEYAEIQLKSKPFLQAIWLIIKRVFTCFPFVKSKEVF